MKETLRRAVARIEVKDTEGVVTARGTGALVAPDLVLTARHVLFAADPHGPPPIGMQIELRFPDRRISATVERVSEDPREDWALLRCSAPSSAVPIPLGDTAEPNDSWETYGFPRAYPDGRPLEGRIVKPSHIEDGQHCLVLHSAYAATGNGDPAPGLAGAPIVVGGTLIGFLRSSVVPLGSAVDGALYGCPIRDVIRGASTVLPALEDYPGLPGVPPGALPGDPFRRWLPYDREHAEVFFGRSREIGRLHDLVAHASPRAPHIILYTGHSGVGKSSLLAAGLGPRLEWSYDFRFLRRRSDLGLAGTLAASLGGEWRDIESAAGRPLVIALDQGEGAFDSGSDAARTEVRELVASLTETFSRRGSRPRGRLILCSRSEWLADWHAAFSREGLPFESLFLSPLNEADIRDVVLGLASTDRLRAHYGLEVEEDLGERIATALVAQQDDTVAPVLQLLLSRMWEEAKQASPSAPVFTAERFAHFAAEGLELTDFVTRQLGRVSPDHLGSGLVLDVLAHYTTEQDTPRPVSRRDMHSHYAHLGERVIDSLVDRLSELQLLMVDEETGAERVTHGTLAAILRRRFENSELPGQRALRILEHGGPEDEHELRIVEEGLDGMRAPAPDEARRIASTRAQREAVALRARMTRMVAIGLALLITVFAISSWLGLRHSEVEREAERVARLESESARAKAFEARRAAAVFQSQAESARQRALVAKRAAEEAQSEAEQARDAAEEERAHALAESPGREREALASVVATVARSVRAGVPPSPRAVRAVLAATKGARRSRVLWAPDPAVNESVSALGLSPDGARILVGLEDGRTLMLSATSSEPPQVVTRGSSPVAQVGFSDDGSLGVARTRGGEAVVFDAASGERRLAVSSAASAGLTRRGDWLVVGDGAGAIEAWNIDSGKLERAWAGEEGAWTNPVPASDGRGVMALRADGSVRRIPIGGGDDTERGRLSQPADAILASNGARALYIIVDALPDDRTSQRMVLWSVLREKSIAERSCHVWEDLTLVGDYAMGTCIAAPGDPSEPSVTIWNRAGRRFTIAGRLVGASPDGTRVAVRTGQDHVELRELPRLRLLDVYENPGGAILAALNNESSRTVEVDKAGVLRVHETDSTWPPSRLYEEASAATFSRDGALSASLHSDVLIKLWDGWTGTVTRTIRAAEQVSRLAFLPSGDLLLGWRGGGPLQAWSTETGEPRGTLSPRADSEQAFVLSPDGKRLVACAQDGAGSLWNLESMERVGEAWCPAVFLNDRRLLEQFGGQARGSTLILRDGRTGERIGILEGSAGEVSRVQLRADRGRLLSSTADLGRTQVWDITTGKLQATVEGQLALDEPSVGAARRFATVLPSEGRVRVWGTDDGAAVAVLLGVDGRPVTADVAASGDRVLVRTSSARGQVADGVEVWDVATLKRTYQLTGCSPSVSASMGARGLRLVVGCKAKGFELVNLTTGEVMAELGGERLLGFSTDGGLLAVVARGGRRVELWDAARGARRFDLGPFADWISHALFTRDGRLLAVQVGARLVVADTRDGSVVGRFTYRTVREQSTDIYQPAFSRTGDMLYDEGGVFPAFAVGVAPNLRHLCELLRPLPEWERLSDDCGAVLRAAEAPSP